MTFGERLKKARENKGLTQEQLAHQIGVAKPTITGYEKGKREPDVRKIKLLAQALSVTGDYLIGNAPEEFSSNERGLIKKYRSLPPEGQKAVSNLLDSLCNITATPETNKEVMENAQQPPALTEEEREQIALAAVKKQREEREHGVRLVAYGGDNRILPPPTQEQIEFAEKLSEQLRSQKKNTDK